MVRTPPSGHRILCVHRQVHEHLLDLPDVHADHAPVLMGGHPDVDVPPDGPPQQLLELADHGPQAHHLGGQLLLPAEGKELARELADAARGAQDLLGGLPLLGGCMIHQQELAPAQDGRQEVVDVVRNPAGHAADRLHFLRLAELLLEDGAVRLGLRSLRDVHDAHEHVRQVVVLRGEVRSG